MTEEKKKKVRILFIGILLIGLISYVCIRYFEKESKPIIGGVLPEIWDADLGPLPGLSEEDLLKQMQKEVDESKFSFKINTKPIFEDGYSPGSLRIENPSHNAYSVAVEIVLKSTGETVYQSGGILPNHHISEAVLTKVLPKGEHSATAYISAYHPDTKAFQGKSAVDLTLIIYK